MFERHEAGERAVVVHIHSKGGESEYADSLSEFEELVGSAGAEALAVVEGSRQRPDPKLYVGAGKADEILDVVRAHDANVVIFNHLLSPAQERNLERHLSCRVIDRTGLILDIFAQRARSFEGKLQVELAQLKHLSTRLIRGWTHLERQKGGIGLRGPGETQLETDRRLLAVRIKQINKRLDQVRRQRSQSRQARRKAEVPTVTLVGYTNAGKSTLFNRLTGESIYAADQLFATLDTTLRRLDLPAGQQVILADTVGFVSDLPHELIDAFHATLLETCDADLLLHVVDASQENYRSQIDSVNSVLAEIGASDVPQLMVFNKIDKTTLAAEVGFNSDGIAERVSVSSLTGAGIDALLEQLQVLLQSERASGWLHLPADMGGFRSNLYQENAVLNDKAQNDGSSILQINLNRYRWEQLCKRHDVSATILVETPEQLARMA